MLVADITTSTSFSLCNPMSNLIADPSGHTVEGLGLWPLVGCDCRPEC